jgi:hypothetical protein
MEQFIEQPAQKKTRRKKKINITAQIAVGLTTPMAVALNLASEISGLSPSALARQAIMASLIQSGYLPHPMSKLQGK